MKRSIVLAALLLAAGCGEPSDRLTDDEASVEQSPAILDDSNAASEVIEAASELPEPEDSGAVLYKAVGNEPGWSLTIRPARMDYAGDYGQVNIAEPTPPSFRPAHGTYRSGKLQLTISAGPCSDGMSDLIYRQTVRVTADGRTVSGCGGGTIAPNTLAGTSWSVVAVNGRPVTGGGDYYVQFSDQTLNAKFGCNSLGAGYSQTGNMLNVGAIMATRMACPDMSFETQGSAILMQPVTISGYGNQLTLSSRSGTIELVQAQ